MADRSGILFYGDPHGCWQPLLDEYARRPARAVVILGDCELDRPLHEVLEPIAADGCPVFWIYGNHDGGSEAQWDDLTRSEGGLHATVANVAGIHAAGLGGTYAGCPAPTRWSEWNVSAQWASAELILLALAGWAA